ncbi:MAG: hypothetical protein AAF467_20040 [Actinomycetota bacterium]
MRFTKPFWAGIADGSITVAYRRWKAPTVVVGRPYRTGGGRVEVEKVDVIDPAAITGAEARRAGYATGDEAREGLRQMGAGGDDREVYRVVFRLLDEADPRDVLANTTDLSADDLAELDARLARLDRASKAGPWTRPTLQLIAENPAIRAPDLAASVGRETQPFKLDVRKLKNLGLTTSLKIGYELSPRGRAYLDATSSTP